MPESERNRSKSKTSGRIWSVKKRTRVHSPSLKSLWIDAEGFLASMTDVGTCFQPYESGAHYLPVRLHLSDVISIYWCRRRRFDCRKIHIVGMFNCLDIEWARNRENEIEWWAGVRRHTTNWSQVANSESAKKGPCRLKEKMSWQNMKRYDVGGRRSALFNYVWPIRVIRSRDECSKGTANATVHSVIRPCNGRRGLMHWTIRHSSLLNLTCQSSYPFGKIYKSKDAAIVKNESSDPTRLGLH